MNRNEIQLMEKGELHVHLNGLVSTDVIRNLLVRDRSDLPSGFDSKLLHWKTTRSCSHFSTEHGGMRVDEL